MRIVSLLPSATETLFALGLGEQLVAVTHECDYPPEAAALPVGMVVGLITDIPSCAELIDRIVSEARALATERGAERLGADDLARSRRVRGVHRRAARHSARVRVRLAA